MRYGRREIQTNPTNNQSPVLVRPIVLARAILIGFVCGGPGLSLIGAQGFQVRVLCSLSKGTGIKHDH